MSSLQGEDIRVFVSSATGARAHDPIMGPGYVVRPTPHLDLNFIWDATTQTFRGKFQTNDEPGEASEEYGPGEAIAYLPATGRRQRTNSGSQYEFQGSINDAFWLFPASSSSSNANSTLYLGFSGYGVPNDGTFTTASGSETGRVFVTVHAVENLTTPSATAFYGYATANLGAVVNMHLTLDPAFASSEMILLADGHSHLNLLFKSPGMYRVTFRVRGTLVATGQEVSSLVPAYFGVETWQIPSGPVPATSYEAWKLGKFSSNQAADPLVSGLNADPDGDGANNLMEYAFHGNPLIAGVMGKPQTESLIDGGREYLAIRFQRRKGDNTLSTTVESTTDLLAVTWSGSGVQVGSGNPVGTDYEEVVYRAPASKAEAVRQFMRVKVVKN